MVWKVLGGVAIALFVSWAALIVLLWRSKPGSGRLKESLRLLPDTVRLLRRLATDHDLSLAVRGRLWLLIVYLAMPIDLVPDFIPVLGYADDAILVALVLRGVVRRAGPDVVAKHWPGTAPGLAALWTAAKLPDLPLA